MKSAFDTITGKITNYDERTGTITIIAPYPDYHTFVKRGYKDVEIRLHDSRRISPEQRRMCWALIREIADWQGQSATETNLDLINKARKLDFLINEAQENYETLFSLSDVPMSLAREYQKYLINFILENGIPTRMPLYKYADDITDYLYHCLIFKKCAVCGLIANLHHVDKVGMGRDREEIIHIGMRCLPLCNKHHDEIHTRGHKEFVELYHLTDGIEIDRTIAKIYKLKTKGA
jgi:hypothetical protein